MSGRHNGSISELQSPEPFTDGEMGAPGGEQSQKQSFQGYFPSSQIRAGASIIGCQNSVLWWLWAQALEPNRLSPADLAKTFHGSELHFLQNMDQGLPDIIS